MQTSQAERGQRCRTSGVMGVLCVDNCCCWFFYCLMKFWYWGLSLERVSCVISDDDCVPLGLQAMEVCTTNNSAQAQQGSQLQAANTSDAGDVGSYGNPNTSMTELLTSEKCEASTQILNNTSGAASAPLPNPRSNTLQVLHLGNQAPPLSSQHPQPQT